MQEREVLHVVVGHGLPTLFLNTLRSVRAICPAAALLVIDNNSPQATLRTQLRQFADADPHTELVLRDRNEPADHKVGGLYAAYRVAFARARSGRFKYVHMLQGDMQLMWWDQDARERFADIYCRHPRCVNIRSLAVSCDRTMMGDIRTDRETGDVVIPRYAMTATGIFHLPRFDRYGIEFGTTEKQLAAAAAQRGLETVVSPWPTEVPVPWPAVVRGGRQVGREVPLRRPYLCRPLDSEQVAAIKTARYPVSLEAICVPWGWSCLAPMSDTDVRSWYYLNYRRQALRRHGLRRGAPRWITRGLDHPLQLLLAPRRPPLWRLLLRPLPSLLKELARRRRIGLID